MDTAIFRGGGGNITLEQILFHLMFPLDGADPRIILSLGYRALLPSFCFAVFFAFILLDSAYQKYIIGKIYQVLLFFYKTRFKVFVLFVIIFGMATIKYMNDKMNMLTYFTSKQEKNYSTFYEEHYIQPLSNLTFPEQKQNLIIIYIESMESTFAKAFDTNLIPNLSKLATTNTSNLLQTNGTGWTIASFTGYECGINLKMPIGGNDFRNKHFLSYAICLGDILDKAGYKQNLITSEGLTGGKTNFFAAHKVNILDKEYFQSIGKLPKDYHVNWGMADIKTFELAKEYLMDYNDTKPFALRIESTDTHSPGYVDPSCEQMYGDLYKDALSCSDRIVSDFVKWIKKQDFYKNTTIVILGDHYTMQRHFVPNDTKRSIYNAFINPAQKLHIAPTRKATHFDIYPTILHTLGFDVDRVALGSNLAKSNQTLIESLGYEQLNSYLAQRNKFYDSFWVKQ